MGVLQWLRTWELTVAPSGGGEGIKITDLRVTFKVEKTSTSEPNKATIAIYNLAPHSRLRIEEQDQAVILKAGYEDLMQVVFMGVVKRAEHKKVPPDIITELECKDGGIDLEAATFRRSYTAGTSRRRVVQDILAAMPNTDTGALTASSLSGSIPGKLALSGSARHVLNRLAGSWGFEWSVQDGVAQVLDKTGTTKPATMAVVLSPSSGLIGSPSRVVRGGKKKTKKTAKIKGNAAKFQCLLQPLIGPGSFVKLESDFVSGYFKVEKASHDGDTHGNNWFTEGEGVDVS